MFPVLGFVRIRWTFSPGPKWRLVSCPIFEPSVLYLMACCDLHLPTVYILNQRSHWVNESISISRFLSLSLRSSVQELILHSLVKQEPVWHSTQSHLLSHSSLPSIISLTLIFLLIPPPPLFTCSPPCLASFPRPYSSTLSYWFQLHWRQAGQRMKSCCTFSLFHSFTQPAGDGVRKTFNIFIRWREKALSFWKHA